MNWKFWQPQSKAETVDLVQHPPFYHMERTREFHAGAMSYAFRPARLLPPMNVYGAGIVFPSRPILPPAPLVVQQTSLKAGLGGIVAGQLVLQPLVITAASGGE